jgi:hypothetical protein
MKPLFFLLAACCTGPVFSQTDSADILLRAATYTSIASLNRGEIERLPATKFMELVQGAFPFIGNASTVEEEYSFVVNGFITINPNAINLSQIQSIQFYPAGRDLTRGSLGKKGTFVISTQPQKSGFSFSTKTGLLLAGDQNQPTALLRYNNGFTSFNEVSYQYKGQRSHFSSAVSYLKNNQPGFLQKQPSTTRTGTSDDSRLRVSNLGSFWLGNGWDLQGGLFLTTQPRHFAGTSNYVPAGLEEQANKQQTLYTGAHAGLRFMLPDKISNHLVAELTYAEGEEDATINGLSGRNYSQKTHGSQLARYYSFTDRFSWTAISGSGISLEANLLTRYRFTRGSIDGLTVGQSNGSAYQSGFQMNTKSKSFAVSPGVVLRLKDWLTAEAGLTYDDYGHSDKGEKTYKKLLPNGGLKLELASLLKGTGISSLELSSTYQKYLTSFDRADLLGTAYRRRPPQVPTFGSIVYANPEAAIYTPSENWVSSLSLGWLQNRFTVKGSYRVYDQMINTYINSFISPGGGALVFLYEPLRSKNWSLEVKATLLDKPSKTWSVYATAFHDKYERKIYNNGMTTTTTVEALYLDAGKAPWRGGLRTAFTLNRFYLQAAALLGVNELGTKKDGTTDDDMVTYRSAFLLAGYQWPTGWKALKGMDLNVQSRNLFHRGSDGTTRYIGLGLHLCF